MRYVFRLSAAAKDRLDVAAPPAEHKRSAFIREAIVGFLCKPKQSLADRPHLRGRAAGYTQVCAILSRDQVDAIKAVYPEVSVSVVIQAAVNLELRKPGHKMEGFAVEVERPIDAGKDTDADEGSNSHARKPKSSRS